MLLMTLYADLLVLTCPFPSTLCYFRTSPIPHLLLFSSVGGWGEENSLEVMEQQEADRNEEKCLCIFWTERQTDLNGNI